MSDISNLPWDKSPSRVRSHPQPQSQSSWPEHVPIPKSFLCPLSKRLMKHPVIDREGNSYERETILSHLRRPGEGFSPVTKNPLQESDLVDNKALMIAIDAIDCALKNAVEEDWTKKQRASTKNIRVSRFRISNPISSSMKVAMQKISTTFEQDTTNKRSDIKSVDVSTEDSLRTEVSESTRDVVLDAITTKARILPVVVSVPITGSMLRPQQTKHKAISSEITGSPPFANKAISSARTHIVSQTSTAADRFEERLINKLSNDSVTRAKSIYEGPGKFDERLRKKLSEDQYFHAKYKRGPRRSKLRNGVSIDQEASADLKKHSHTTMGPVKIEGGSHSGPKKPAKRETIRSNTKYSFDSRNRSPDVSAVVTEDGYYVQLKDDRRRRRGHKQGEFVQKRRLSLTKSLTLAKASIVSVERRAGTEKEHHSRRQVDHTSAKLGENKVIPNEPTHLPSVNNAERSDEITIKNHGAFKQLDKFEKNLRKKLSDDLAVRAKYERKSRQPKSQNRVVTHRDASAESKKQSQTSMASLEEEEDSPNSQNIPGKGDTVRPNNKYSSDTRNGSSKFEADLEENVDDTQFQEDTRRKWKGDKLDQRSNHTRTTSLKQAKEGGISTRYSMINERRTGPGRERRLIQFSSREASEMSELTFKESYSDLAHDKVVIGKHKESIPSTRSTENEEHREPSLAGKIPENSQGNLPAQSRVCSDRSHRALSWADLSGEIVCAEVLSMKMTGSDALELQTELASHMLAEFELESYPSGESYEPAASVLVKRPMVPRGGSRQEDIESSSLGTFDDKVGALMETVEGSDKTKFDVSNALEQAKGDMGYAMEILLQSSPITRNVRLV